MASKPSPEVTLHSGPNAMDDVLKWTSKVSVTEGQPFTTPKPGPLQMIFSMFHASEFPFEGGVPTSPLQLKSPQAQQMDQAVIVPDEFEIKPIDSGSPAALQNRRHRTFAKTGFSWDGNVLTRLGFYSEVTSTEFLLKNNAVLQIGGLKDEATSQFIPNSPNPPIFKLVNSWRFGGGKYLGAAEGRNMVPTNYVPSFLGSFGQFFLGWAGGKVGEWFTPANYASVKSLVIPPTDTADGVLVAKTTYQPLATHHFGFAFSTPKLNVQFVMTKPSSTNNPSEARNLKLDFDAFRIGYKDGKITKISLEEAIGIAKQRNVLNPVDSVKAIDDQADIQKYLRTFE